MATNVTECISCDGSVFRHYCEGLVSCENCGLVVAGQIPSAAEVQELYREDYFFGKEYFNYEADRAALERNFKGRMGRLGYMFDPEFRVVEIGCAYGYFLNLIKDRVGDHAGFDVSQEGVDYARKELQVNAMTEEFLTYETAPNSIDSIFMWDVIEHLAHPEDYLRKVRECLKPGGHVALTTGNVDAWVARKRGSGWRMIHPPTHVYYFSPHTLELLFKKYGMTVVSVKHKSVTRNVGSILNQLISNRRASHLTAGHLVMACKVADLIRASRLNIPINMYDIMEVVAVKD